MTQAISHLSSEEYSAEKLSSENSSLNIASSEYLFDSFSEKNVQQSDVSLENGVQLKSVMSELNRLSKSFVNSYQTLENQVEKLNCQLKTEAEEKQELLVEKASLSDRLQNLLTIMPAGFVVIDGLGKVSDCNAMAVDILGRPLIGQLWFSVIQRAFQPQADDGHQVSLKDGRKIHIETRALESEPGQLVVLTDLTKTRELQAELSQQHKLSSMGKMIASLAHQVRTPLSAAILYGSHLNKNEITEETRQKFNSNLMERLHFMERQITDMLNFVKGERKDKSLCNPRVIFNCIDNMKNEFKEELKVSYEVSGSASSASASIYADQDALTGALINLVENASDACKARENAQIELAFKVGNELVISVTDNGKGISQENQKKIFEPFFTNKKNGNGLGLSVVHGIIIDHKGRIKVVSEEKKGTRFEISIPLVASDPAACSDTRKEKSYEF